MRDIVTARLVLRPITTEEVSAVLTGQRRSDWADDFPAEGDQVIARLLARTGMPADDAARRFGHRLVVERDAGTVVTFSRGTLQPYRRSAWSVRSAVMSPAATAIAACR